MKKIYVVITARPSYTRIKGVLEILKNSEKVNLSIITMASANSEKYGNVSEQIRKDGFRIEASLDTFIYENSITDMCKTTAKGIETLSEFLKENRPDALITIADRFETIATAISAAYMSIPLIHIQGGEKTGSIDNRVRHAVSKLADYHLVSTQNAKEYLKQLDEKEERIWITGCASIDIAKQAIQSEKDDTKIIVNAVINKHLVNVPEKYIMVMQHPDTNDEKNIETQIAETIKAIENIKEDVFWFTPNVDGNFEKINEQIKNIKKENVYFIKNLPTDIFIRLLNKAMCLVGNSSTGIREAGFLGVPVVNIGKRQNLREREENVFDVDYDCKDIKQCIEKIKNKRFKKSKLYGDGNSSEKIALFLEKQKFTLKEKSNS